MRPLLKIIILCSIPFSFCFDDKELPIEKEILILTESTFDESINKYDNLLVMFYAPWCTYCKKFIPELEKAAEILRKEHLFVAKVDATIEINLANKYNIQAYPTLKFFKNGIEINYDGKRKAMDVINWVRQKSSPPTRLLKSWESFEKFKKENPVCIIYYGSNSQENKIFTNIAIKIEDYPFGIVENEEIINKAKEKLGTVVVYKNFDEKRNEINNFDEEKLMEFVELKTQKKISNFDDKTTEIIFGKNQPTITYFGEKGKHWDEVEKIFEKIVDKIIEKKLKVTMTEINGGMGRKIAEYIGLKKSQIPSIRIIDTRYKEMKKYILDKEINEENILEFVEGWEKGILKRYFKSQEEPKYNKGIILELVGRNFKNKVIDNDYDVIVLFYSPKSENYKKYLKEYIKAANKLKEKNEKIIFAKIDATENEVEGIEIKDFPTFKFWPGNSKNLTPKDFNMDVTAEGIIKFLKNNCFNRVILNAKGNNVKNTEL